MNKTNFVDIIFQKSDSQPDKIILMDQWRNWTWHDILSRSFEYSEIIRENFQNKVSAIPILVGRSGESIAAIIGTIISGHIFAPISLNQPTLRIKNIIDSLNSDKALSGLHYSEKKPKKLKFVELVGSKTVRLENNKPKHNKLLYILFTSGSTGKPKGVLCSHENILNTIIWSKQYLNWNKTDIMGCATQFSFDISMFDFFTLLYYDVPLAILNNTSNPNDILEQLSKFKVTSIFSVPEFFTQFTSKNLIKNISKTKLRRIISGGGFFPPKHVLFWIKNCPKISIYNVWGPTETSIVNTMYKISKSDYAKMKKGLYPSIGKSHSLMPLVLLNSKNQQINESNVVGEFVMLGKCVSIEYFKDPKETQRKYFVFDGKPAFLTGDLGYKDQDDNFYITGRNDNLVKIYGYRIDLNEIENTITQFPNVHTTLLIVHNNDDLHKELWAAVELKKNSSKFNIFLTKKKLRTLLPNYMVPKRIFIMPKIPLTPNGKPDKKKTIDYIHHNLIK